MQRGTLAKAYFYCLETRCPGRRLAGSDAFRAEIISQSAKRGIADAVSLEEAEPCNSVSKEIC